MPDAGASQPLPLPGGSKGGMQLQGTCGQQGSSGERLDFGGACGSSVGDAFLLPGASGSGPPAGLVGGVLGGPACGAGDAGDVGVHAALLPGDEASRQGGPLHLEGQCEGAGPPRGEGGSLFWAGAGVDGRTATLLGELYDAFGCGAQVPAAGAGAAAPTGACARWMHVYVRVYALKACAR